MTDPRVPPPVPPAPAFSPPPGYAPPAGYGAPSAPGWAPAPARATRRSTLGVVAFVLSLLASVVASAIAAVAAYPIGAGAGEQLTSGALGPRFDWSILSPVRDWVLVLEVAFWAGTVLGIWALVQGIVAIARRAGRGWGIAAVVCAAVGPVLFAIVVQAVLVAGLAASASAG